MTPKKGADDNSSKEFPRWLIPAITGTIALAFGAFIYRQGIIASSDTATYSGWADALISDHFNYLAWTRETNFVVPPILYAGWTTVVALFKLLLGAAWMKGIVALNYALALAVIWGLLKLVKRTTESALSVVAAGALALVAFETFNFIRYVLSDISYMALAFAIFYLLCTLPQEEDAPAKSRALSRSDALLMALIVLALIYRPTGFPLLLLAALAYLLRGRALAGREARARLMRQTGIVFGVLALVVITLHAYFMMNPSAWPTTFAARWIQRLSGEYHKGYVVFQRPETFYPNPATLFDFIMVTLKKLVYFFCFYLGTFSLAHNLVNFIFFFPVYVLSLVAIYKMFRRERGLGFKAWWCGWLALLWIILYALFHALQQIDYDWRYRSICLPPFITLASIGLKSVLNKKHAPEGDGQL